MTGDSEAVRCTLAVVLFTDLTRAQALIKYAEEDLGARVVFRKVAAPGVRLMIREEEAVRP